MDLFLHIITKIHVFNERKAPLLNEKCCKNIFHFLTVIERLSFLHIKNTHNADNRLIMQHYPQNSAKCKPSRH